MEEKISVFSVPKTSMRLMAHRVDKKMKRANGVHLEKLRCLNSQNLTLTAFTNYPSHTPYKINYQTVKETTPQLRVQIEQFRY